MIIPCQWVVATSIIKRIFFRLFRVCVCAVVIYFNINNNHICRVPYHTTNSMQLDTLQHKRQLYNFKSM